MEVITDASSNFESLELLFSLLVNDKIYREDKNSSKSQWALPPLQGCFPSSSSRVSLSPQLYASLAQEGIIKCTLQSECLLQMTKKK